MGLRLRLGPPSQQDGFYSRAGGGHCALEPDRWLQLQYKQSCKNGFFWALPELPPPLQFG